MVNTTGGRSASTLAPTKGFARCAPQRRGEKPMDMRVDHRIMQYGPFGSATVKPFSVTRRSVDGASILKVYRGVQPRARRLREADALQLGCVRTGRTGDGRGGGLRLVRSEHRSGCLRFHRHDRGRVQLCPTHAQPNRERPRTRSRPEPQARARLVRYREPSHHHSPTTSSAAAFIAVPPTALVECPAEHAHTARRPAHSPPARGHQARALLAEGENVHVLDWEASARGPAVCDHADGMFHLVRDLIYAGMAPQHLPVDVISRVPATGSVLAWRVVQWLDRRCPRNINELSLREFHRIALASTSTEAVRALGRLIALLRAVGVPR
jgi:hypothetical protein